MKQRDIFEYLENEIIVNEITYKISTKMLLDSKRINLHKKKDVKLILILEKTNSMEIQVSFELTNIIDFIKCKLPSIVFNQFVSIELYRKDLEDKKINELLGFRAIGVEH